MCGRAKGCCSLRACFDDTVCSCALTPALSCCMRAVRETWWSAWRVTWCTPRCRQAPPSRTGATLSSSSKPRRVPASGKSFICLAWTSGPSASSSAQCETTKVIRSPLPPPSTKPHTPPAPSPTCTYFSIALVHHPSLPRCETTSTTGRVSCSTSGV